MKLTKVIFAFNVAVLLAACGSTSSSGGSSGNSSSTGSTTSSTGSSSTGSSTSGSSGGPVKGLGYSKLSDGHDGWNYEPSEISTNTRPNYNREESITAFEDTLYPYLRANCGGCHSSDSTNMPGGQAPLHADVDVALAHDYALTRTNFANTIQSKLVDRSLIERHACIIKGQSDACEKAGARILAKVDEWKSKIEHMLPEAPRSTGSGQLSESDIEAAIAADKAGLSSSDKEFMVYVSLHESYNDGMSAADLNIIRSGLSKALNSVARWAPEIKNPIDVKDGLLYRFDTRWYWGYNKGVKEILFGGSDDDMAFGQNKKGYKGNSVTASVQSKKYNYSSSVTQDENLAKMIWERVLHGNVEGADTGGNIDANVDGFHGRKSTNAAGEYVEVSDFEWVEASQLVYTLTRPDVYNSVMLIPFYADQLERELGVIIDEGVDSYDLVTTWEAITVDSRLLWRAKRKDGGWYWKSWDIFTGDLPSGRDRSIYDVYKDDDGKDIRFPWWANPIPKFVNPARDAADNSTYSFISSLAQTGGFTGFAPRNHAGCDDVDGAVQGFGFCQHYSGVGGAMQSASEIIWDLDNGLQGYMLTGGFNQRRLDAFVNIVRDPRILLDAADNVADTTGYSYTNGGGGFRAGDPRLNNGSSCIGCHINGMNRINNDMGDWVRDDQDRLPRGEKYGAEKWLNDSATVERVKELYPRSDVIRKYNEDARKTFMGAMAEINNGMLLGSDKNVFVEPIIWTVEYAQRTKYNYKQTTSN